MFGARFPQIRPAGQSVKSYRLVGSACIAHCAIPHFGGAEGRWNIIPFCFTFDGRRDRNGARVKKRACPVRGRSKGTAHSIYVYQSIWHCRYGSACFHVPDISETGGTALYAILVRCQLTGGQGRRRRPGDVKRTRHSLQEKICLYHMKL